MPSELSLETFDQLGELSLPRARGRGMKAEPLTVKVLRAISEDDLEQLAEANVASAPKQKLAELRHQHHEIARLLAKGEPLYTVSALTGKSPAYLSTLKSDPAFAALLDHYKGLRDEIFIDAVQRMKQLGICTLDELQARLDDKPEKFSHRELMELAKLTLVEPHRGPNAGSTASGQQLGPNVAVSVSFISTSNGSKQLELEAKKDD